MANHGEKCPICGEGNLHAMVEKNQVEYRGHKASLDSCYSICDACGSEQANAVQLRTNKRAMTAFKKQVDGLLTGAEVRALREKLKINQAEASQIFGGGPVAFSKYESDDVAQSEAMDKLLRLAVAVPDAFASLLEKAGMKPKVSGQWMKAEIEVSQPKQPSLRVISSSHPNADQGWRKTG